MADRGTGRFWEAPNYVNRRLRLLPGTRTPSGLAEVRAVSYLMGRGLGSLIFL